MAGEKKRKTFKTREIPKEYCRQQKEIRTSNTRYKKGKP